MQIQKIKSYFFNPFVVLVLLSMTLTELGCGNMPPRQFFNPILFCFLIIVYGFPAVLIRDLSLRWKLGLPGLFVLGLAYGFYNEGICAKTLMLVQNVPVNTFDGYVFLDVNWAWAFLIVPWHAIYAMVFPILITNYLFPGEKHQKLLSRKQRITLLGFVIVVGMIGFLTSEKVTPTATYYILFTAIITVLIFISRFMPRTLRDIVSLPCNKIKVFLFGLIFYILFLFGMVYLSYFKLHEVVLLGYIIALLSLTVMLIIKKKWFSYPSIIVIVLGSYMAIALLSIHHGIKFGLTDLLVSNSLLILALLAAVWRLKKVI